MQELHQRYRKLAEILCRNPEVGQDNWKYRPEPFTNH
jgi:hypothetical protein